MLSEFWPAELCGLVEKTLKRGGDCLLGWPRQFAQVARGCPRKKRRKMRQNGRQVLNRRQGRGPCPTSSESYRIWDRGRGGQRRLGPACRVGEGRQKARTTQNVPTTGSEWERQKSLLRKIGRTDLSLPGIGGRQKRNRCMEWFHSAAGGGLWSWNLFQTMKSLPTRIS